MPTKRPYRVGKNGVQLFVRVTPNASSDRIIGFYKRDNDSVYLRLSVTAIAEKNKANKAVIALLAKSLKLPKNSFQIVAGHAVRSKKISIHGQPEELVPRLDVMLELLSS